MSIITLTTDFGASSPYVGAMKGVVLSINPAATIVDLTHAIRPQDVRHGALVLEDVADRFPAGTIHVAVVDPGVGTDRAIVFARIGRQHYVAPDNGLLSRVARLHVPEQIVRLAEPAYWLHPVSSTFHGRDIMAPAAAWLSLGLEPSRLGPPQERLVEIDWPEPQRSPGVLDGEVLAIDSFGNLITNITADLIAELPRDERIQVAIGDRPARGIARTYGERRPGELIALVGSSNRLEVAVVDGNAAQALSASVGDRVSIHGP